jgi:hypothetical protein
LSVELLLLRPLVFLHSRPSIAVENQLPTIAAWTRATHKLGFRRREPNDGSSVPTASRFPHVRAVKLARREERLRGLASGVRNRRPRAFGENRGDGFEVQPLGLGKFFVGSGDLRFRVVKFCGDCLQGVTHGVAPRGLVRSLLTARGQSSRPGPAPRLELAGIEGAAFGFFDGWPFGLLR